MLVDPEIVLYLNLIPKCSIYDQIETASERICMNCALVGITEIN